MKSIIPLFLLFSLSLFSVRLIANTKPMDSKIEKVTVFLSGAQVSRAAATNLAAGQTILLIKNVSPNLDPQSIQVKGDGAFTILSVSHQLNYLEAQKKRTEIAQLETRKYQLNAERKRQTAKLSVREGELNLLSKNQSVGGSNTGIVATELKEITQFYRERMETIFNEQLDIQQKIFGIDSTLQLVQQQLTALHQERETATSEILITVKANEAIPASFEVDYYVQNAGWFATYDLRVQDVSSPIDLSFKANVFQQTGEDWKDVSLVLSSGDPAQSGFAQSLSPWYLRYNQRYAQYKPNKERQGLAGVNKVEGVVLDETGEPLIGATVLIEGSSIGTITDINGKYSIHLPNGPANLIVSYTGYSSERVAVKGKTQNITLSGGLLLSEVVITGGRNKLNMPTLNIDGIMSTRKDRSIAQENIENYQTTTFNYEIESRYTIVSDGTSRMVDIKTENISADYQYYAVPKLDESVYLTAAVQEWQDLNLLDGEVNLFFEGTFLGKSLLDVQNASDTLEVSLGVDKGIVVKRTKLKDYMVKRFLGSNKIESRGFEIYVRNNKPQTIHLLIEDQFPISTNKDMVVEDLKYDGAKRDKESEMLSWRLSIPPGAEESVQLKYTVKYPKRKNLFLE